MQTLGGREDPALLTLLGHTFLLAPSTIRSVSLTSIYARWVSLQVKFTSCLNGILGNYGITNIYIYIVHGLRTGVGLVPQYTETTIISASFFIQICNMLPLSLLIICNLINHKSIVVTYTNSFLFLRRISPTTPGLSVYHLCIVKHFHCQIIQSRPQ